MSMNKRDLESLSSTITAQKLSVPTKQATAAFGRLEVERLNSKIWVLEACEVKAEQYSTTFRLD